MGRWQSLNENKQKSNVQNYNSYQLLPADKSTFHRCSCSASAHELCCLTAPSTFNTKAWQKRKGKTKSVLIGRRGAVVLVADWFNPLCTKIVGKRWSWMIVSLRDGGEPRRRVAKTEACRFAMQSVISALANDKVMELVVFKTAQWWQTNTGSHQTIVHIT